jgi:MarR family transcriptional regulator, negative regulator of the multidrug operon emrRAB
MSTNPSFIQGPLELRVAEIESATRQISNRFPEASASDILTLRVLMLLGREMSSLLENALRPHNLNDTDFRILICLVSQPDGVACPSDLCAFVAQSPANMTRVADALSERGLITRTTSEQDRRRTMLRITPAGEALARSLMPLVLGVMHGVYGDMPNVSRRTLLDLLRQLTAQIDRRGPSR